MGGIAAIFKDKDILRDVEKAESNTLKQLFKNSQIKLNKAHANTQDEYDSED
jgi:hypothetical protein